MKGDEFYQKIEKWMPWLPKLFTRLLSKLENFDPRQPVTSIVAIEKEIFECLKVVSGLGKANRFIAFKLRQSKVVLVPRERDYRIIAVGNPDRAHLLHSVLTITCGGLLYCREVAEGGPSYTSYTGRCDRSHPKRLH